MSEPTIELGGPSDRSETQVQLSVVAGPHAGTTWVFDRRTELILGRDRPAQLVLPDEPALSRSHLKLRISPPHVEFIDQQSRNGTQVNGVHVVSATLRDGDRLSVGQTELLLKTITSGADEAVGSLEETQATSERVNPAETTTPKQSDRSGGDDLFSHDGSDQKRSAGASRVGEDIGPYELIEVLGSGGMAIVYKAVHRRTRETVAVKLIRGDLPQSAKQMNLFVREARLLSQLHHPRIVKSIEFGIHDRHPYLAMEHIESLDLMELIDGYDAKRKLRISLWVISRALEALHYLHSQDIVHRDIKPSNILAYREGHRLQVKLADFGLAKLFVDAGFSGITNEKSVRGTLAYMSPEQFHRSRDAKPEDDLFSCGATLYRLLLGEFPNMLFKPDQTLERLDASTFPSNITNIIAKSISLKREERFLTVEDFAESVKSCRST